MPAFQPATGTIPKVGRILRKIRANCSRDHHVVMSTADNEHVGTTYTSSDTLTDSHSVMFQLIGMAGTAISPAAHAQCVAGT